jgi:hypothetical protein
MLKRFGLLLIMIVLLAGLQTVWAQGAPSQIEFALQDLSSRVGQPVTAADLETFTWQETIYPNTALGCPQPGEVYAEVQTRGFQFVLTYQGQVYDYRVSSDGSMVVLCQGAEQPTATAPADGAPAPEPTVAQPTAVPPTVPPATVPPVPTTPTAAPDLGVSGMCADGLLPLLTVGQQARIAPGVPSIVRAQPALTAEQVAEIPAGGSFAMVEGPVCGDDGLTWWQIQSDDVMGWIAQGEGGVYYVEPIPQALPAAGALTPLAADNVEQLVELSRIQGNVAAALAWTPDGAALAVASTDPVNTGVWLYDVAALATDFPRLLETEIVPSALAFSPDGLLLAIGGADGTIELWDWSEETVITSIAAHQVAVRTLSFNPDSTLLASVDENLTIALWGVAAGAEG